MFPVRCFTCNSVFVGAMQDDYIEGVYIKRRQPNEVLDEIARKYKTSGQMNLCCRGVLMTHPVSQQDIDDVKDLIRQRGKQAKITSYPNGIFKPHNYFEEQQQHEMLTVPLDNVVEQPITKERVAVIVEEPVKIRSYIAR